MIIFYLINNLIEDLFNQCFLNTATWGLKYFESLLDIETNKTKPFNERREIIKAALLGHGTVTIKLIKEVSESYTDSEIEIEENIRPFVFKIRFTGVKGIPKNLEDLKERINIIKPAHLIVEYDFTYNTWDMIKHMTWGEAKNITWEELRIR